MNYFGPYAGGEEAKIYDRVQTDDEFLPEVGELTFIKVPKSSSGGKIEGDVLYLYHGKNGDEAIVKVDPMSSTSILVGGPDDYERAILLSNLTFIRRKKD